MEQFLPTSNSDIDDAPAFLLRQWWATVPRPTSDEEREVVERLAMRCEGLGLVDAAGKLRG